MDSTDPENTAHRRHYHTRNQELDRMIQDLVQKAGGSPDTDLIEELMVSALKIREDAVERGDIKLLNTALKELRYALSVFTPYRHIRKVAIFGSARTPSSSPDYKLAREFASLVAKEKWMVITGAASGIMHAGNEGAGRANSFGVNIRLPFEQTANPHIVNDPKLISFKYFFTRKLIFIKESDATVLFPGGFGTHDEGFETITLVQTGKTNPRPVVCLDHPQSRYWKDWFDFIRKHLAKTGMIDKNDLSFVYHTHSAKEAVKIITNFYSNYHSGRYIGERLILRIRKPLSKSQLDVLNLKFKDILTQGQIEQHAKPFHEEENEPHIQDLTRLSLHFDRHQIGRLHQLIEALNQS